MAQAGDHVAFTESSYLYSQGIRTGTVAGVYCHREAMKEFARLNGLSWPLVADRFPYGLVAQGDDGPCAVIHVISPVGSSRPKWCLPVALTDFRVLPPEAE
jgi:hypothetical protein